MRDLTNQVFGRLTARCPIGRIRSSLLWFCTCSCGGSKNIASCNLIKGITQSCGCIRREVEDLTNQKFGRLTAICRDGKECEGAKWFCVCECGGCKTVAAGNLRRRKSRSCGCYRSEEAVRRCRLGISGGRPKKSYKERINDSKSEEAA
jgi:hypothetical protein